MDPFIKLTTKLTNSKLKVEDKLKEVCLTTAELINGADRISLWRFTADFDAIEAMICYDAKSGCYSSGQLLKKSDFNDYFNGILNHDVINAAQARTHELTQCFNETYFLPHNIHSLLDVILHRDFTPHGVICCESVGNVTQWSEIDIESLNRIARASSLYFKYDG